MQITISRLSDQFGASQLEVENHDTSEVALIPAETAGDFIAQARVIDALPHEVDGDMARFLWLLAQDFEAESWQQ